MWPAAPRLTYRSFVVVNTGRHHLWVGRRAGPAEDDVDREEQRNQRTGIHRKCSNASQQAELKRNNARWLAMSAASAQNSKISCVCTSSQVNSLHRLKIETVDRRRDHK